MIRTTTRLTWLVVLGLLPSFLFSQSGLKFKLQLMPDGERWGVYVRPDDSINPSTGQTIVGSGQVTVVMPKDYQLSDFQNENGSWTALNAINSPMENPTKKYQSIGFNSEIIPIQFVTGQETLLFTFKNNGSCPDNIQLISNELDPFMFLPNSIGNFPGNEITVFDMITADVYEYAGNYATAAWDCHDNDSDGILNAHEDTNGNGVYDAGADASDLNSADMAGANNDIQFKLQLMPDGDYWGVYAQPSADADISQQTVTGTAQVTVVMPADYQWSSLTNVSGTWSAGGSINAPSFAPDKKYVSFGLMSDFPQIKFRPNQETLLFKFKREGDCPEDIHLYPSNGLLPPDSQWNLGNDITTIDVLNFEIHGYGGNYAEMAWDCHDNDGDGVANALEDTNGNGVYDPNIDASDLNEVNPPSCLKLKLQLLPDSSGWAVVAKATGPLANAQSINLQHGRVTIIYPAGMDFTGYDASATGWGPIDWNTLPSNPNRNYITFETNGSPQLDMANNHETELFRFPKNGDCPNFLYIMEEFPAGVQANELRAFSAVDNDLVGFNFCGVYSRKAWRCKKPGGLGGPIIVVTTDSLETDNPQAVVDREGDTGKGDKVSFTATPNPAGDHVNITVSSELAEGRPTLSLFDLQGRKHLETQLEASATKLDLSGLPAGVYFVSLAQNGRVVQREKFIKH
ncbi:MAG: T9SS type A sorting domain-containing protein [Saprospiraceae bacterium]|nr:T9SS type A sorting domain-containing protein [Saprospiraceae bacterium]